ncbi:MAG TPA: hypothetical protein VFB80_10140, partial [Pirellulaceae bacterium]|nr:hypothetical protein [Pirellulaceae bacterium]
MKAAIQQAIFSAAGRHWWHGRFSSAPTGLFSITVAQRTSAAWNFLLIENGPLAHASGRALSLLRSHWRNASATRRE